MANEQNLRPPWRSGQSGNPNGRPKGRKSLATIVRELEREDFNWRTIPVKDSQKLQDMYGSPFKAIVARAIAQALNGDKAAREWLRKAGYGDKLDITTDGDKIIPILGGASAIPEDNSDQQTPEPPQAPTGG